MEAFVGAKGLHIPNTKPLLQIQFQSAFAPFNIFVLHKYLEQAH